MSVNNQLAEHLAILAKEFASFIETLETFIDEMYKKYDKGVFGDDFEDGSAEMAETISDKIKEMKCDLLKKQKARKLYRVLRKNQS